MSFLINPYRFATAGGGGDPYFSSVTLLLHGEGTNGSTTITDSSSFAQTVTASGNAQIDTAQFKWGSASINFDGSGDYVSTVSSADFDISGDWTVEFFIRPASLATNLQRMIAFEKAGETWGLYNSGSALQWARFGAAGLITSSSVLVVGTWLYAALVRSGGTTTLYVNGASVGSTTSSPSSGSYIFRVGGTVTNFPTQNLNANVDEIRFTKLARTITATPTAAFPDS